MDSLKPEFNSEKVKTHWYHSAGAIVIAILVGGPFALPVVWINPKISRLWKIVISGGVILVTWFLIVSSARILQLYIAKLNDLKNIYSQ